jgi:hypothetical protein
VHKATIDVALDFSMISPQYHIIGAKMPSQAPQSASLEHITRAANGWAMLLVSIALLVAANFLVQITAPPESPVHILGALIAATGLSFLFGFFTLQPNEARVLILFGAYKGTVRNSGFHWANPLYARKRGNAVTMVHMALDELDKKNVVKLDDERKAAMVSNLLVVLCGSSEASPVINTGTLYS